ncbi:heparinase II/III family protein [Parafrankia sp. FMc6]|uniref:heparinase II/III domain-containing protein n=1 Tax=Parafrankia soli TaxID=2599596 RepID=UPI0034D59B54
MLKTTAADAAALGPGAVPRAAYEVSKRIGGHAVIFGGIGFAPRGAGGLLPLGLPRGGDVPGAEPRLAADTADAAKGLVRVFGRSVDLGPQTDWHAVLEAPGRWPATHWWGIDIRSDVRLGDVKWVWELGRMRHLVVLARTVALTSDRAALERLRADLESWFAQNPPERGIHWYSNLEIALRAFALVQVHELAGAELGPRLCERIGEDLRHARRHILADLIYTASSMRNNHWLGDSLGLLVLDRALPADRLSGARRHVARRLFGAQLHRQVRTDGSMIEDSLSYHRFVLEMLVVRMVVDPTAQVRDALVRAAQFLSRFGVFEGPVPQFGDWDEGRTLASSGDPREVVGSVAAALAIAGSGAPGSWRADYDECAWYVPPGQPIAPERGEADGHDVGGGIARARRGPWTSWLKVGSGPSHGHADLCSTHVLHDGQWVVGDPGTGTYNGPLEQRNGLRTSAAHSVLCLGGEEQLNPHRVFRWRHTARGWVGPPITIGDAVVSWGFHDAYRRLDPPRRVARVVVTSPDGVACADYVEGPFGLDWRLTLPLAPDAEVDLEASTVQLVGGTVVGLTLPGRATSIRGSVKPWAGWWSQTYGDIEPTTWLRLAGRVEGPVLWAVHSGPEPPASCDGEDLVLGTTTVSLEWATDHVRLTARGERETTVFAEAKV